MKGAAYRVLLRFLPRSFRVRHGTAMEEVFAQRLQDARRRGVGAVLGLVAREVVDVGVTGLRLRARGRWTRGVARGTLDDLRQAVRSLARRPVFTLFVASTVALGVAATTAVYGALESLILRPVPYRDGDRMVTIWRTIGTSGSYMTPSAAEVEAWQGQTDLFERMEPYAIRYMTLGDGGESRLVRAGLVGPSYLELLRMTPALGRMPTPEETRGDGARVLLLGHALWKDRFGGDPRVLGQTLSLDGDPWTVVGVMPAGARLLGFELLDMDLWRPLPESMRESRQVVAVLRAGVSLDTVNRRLASLDERLASEEGAPREGRGEALLVGALVGRSYQDALRVLQAGAALLLLITCANVSSLLLHRAASRRRETAVRAALGAGRGRLARQLLLESLLLALLGGAAGVALAREGMVATVALRPDGLAALAGLRLDGRVLLLALAATLGTGILFGLLPAWQVTRPGATECLRGGARGGSDGPGGRARWALVAGEMALSFALVLGTTAVLGTLVGLQRTDPGFRASEVVVLDAVLPEWRYGTPAERDDAFEGLRRRLATLPGVERVATSMGAPPGAGIWFGALEVEGRPPDDETSVLHGPAVSPGYFAAMGQPVLEGRPFTDEESGSDAHVLILGEGAARRLFAGESPVGRRMRVGGGDWFTVLGVVTDVAMTGLGATRTVLQAYRPLPNGVGDRTFLVRIAPGTDPRDLLPTIRQVASRVPGIRLDGLSTAEARLRDTLARERFTTGLLGTFTGLALILAAVGLYGVVSQVVGGRTREIGIRMALGARSTSIGALVLRNGALAVVAGLVAGAGLVALGLPVLKSRLVGLEGRGAAPWAAATLILVATTLLASWLPARRATRVDPSEALRTE